MKKILATVLAAGLLACAGAARAAEVGVSIGIHQPGLSGRIDLGRFPVPVLFAPQPVIVRPPPYVVAYPQPVYLWETPAHHRHGHRHRHGGYRD